MARSKRLVWPTREHGQWHTLSDCYDQTKPQICNEADPSSVPLTNEEAKRCLTGRRLKARRSVGLNPESVGGGLGAPPLLLLFLRAPTYA